MHNVCFKFRVNTKAGLGSSDNDIISGSIVPSAYRLNHIGNGLSIDDNMVQGVTDISLSRKLCKAQIGDLDYPMYIIKRIKSQTCLKMWMCCNTGTYPRVPHLGYCQIAGARHGALYSWLNFSFFKNAKSENLEKNNNRAPPPPLWSTYHVNNPTSWGGSKILKKGVRTLC